MHKAIIVGCGLTGSVIARHLAEEKHYDVTILERRNHIAGNLYDFVDENGILVQRYGPHIFHTNSESVYEYITRFHKWNPFKLECMVYMNGHFTPSPFNFATIDTFFPAEKAAQIKEHLRSAYPSRDRATIVEMLESTDAVVREYAQFLFDNDYSLYTAKQWGISPSEIDVSVLRRVPVLFSYETGYFKAAHELMPQDGFTSFVRSILDHPNIHIELGQEAQLRIRLCEEQGEILLDGTPFHGPVIWTGMLDQLFCADLGQLPYRSLRFEWKTCNQSSYQQAPVVAYPQEEGFTRIAEYSKLPVQQCKERTTLAVEYPTPYKPDGSTEPYYPIPTAESQKLYQAYLQRASHFKNLYPCGRLGQYRYYDMDNAIEAALEIAGTIPSAI